MAELMLINPRKRRRKKTAKRKTPVKRARRRTTARRVKRNPARRQATRTRGMQGIINNQLIPAVTAGAGALSLDVIMGYLPLPAMFATGPVRYGVKGIGAILLGTLAGMVGVRKSTANQLAMGALTVTVHEAMKETMTRFAPGVPLGYWGAGMTAGPGFNPQYNAFDGMGMYVDSGGAGAGFAPQIPQGNGATCPPGCAPAETENMSMYTGW